MGLKPRPGPIERSRALLARGADRAATKRDGSTAADRAAHHGHRELAVRLRR